MNCKKAFGITFIVFILLMINAFPATAHGSAGESTDEVIEHAEELIEISTTIHDQTMYIADDENLDDDLRAAGESIHLSSHDIEHIGNHIKEHAEELKGLLDDPEANEEEIMIALEEINEHTDEAMELVESKEADLEKVLADSPQTHQQYAEAIEDAVMEAGSIANHINLHAAEVEESLGFTEEVVLEGDTATSVASMEEIANEMLENDMIILNSTRELVRDETLDQDWRNVSKEVHMASHTVETASEKIIEEIDELKPLLTDPDTNEAAVKNKLTNIREHAQSIMDEFEANHEAVHAIVELEEPYHTHATITHDKVHEVEYEAKQLQKKAEKLEEALYPAEEETSEPVTSEVSEETETTSTPGFGIILACMGIFAAVGLLRRK